jgi:hypothetical protein
MTFTSGAHVDTDGTSLQGYLPTTTTYQQLVDIFGLPEIGPGPIDFKIRDKTTCSWSLRFEDGTVATIYDWKMFKTPRGGYPWCVGGFSKRAFDLVEQAMKGSREA